MPTNMHLWLTHHTVNIMLRSVSHSKASCAKSTQAMCGRPESHPSESTITSLIQIYGKLCSYFPRFSHHTCPILLSYLVSDTGVLLLLHYWKSQDFVFPNDGVNGEFGGQALRHSKFRTYRRIAESSSPYRSPFQTYSPLYNYGKTDA
jgi:hypothetical protein